MEAKEHYAGDIPPKNPNNICPVIFEEEEEEADKEEMTLKETTKNNMYLIYSAACAICSLMFLGRYYFLI